MFEVKKLYNFLLVDFPLFRVVEKMLHLASTVFKDLNGLSHHVKSNLVIMKMENSSDLWESSSITGIFLRVSCGIILSHPCKSHMENV